MAPCHGQQIYQRIDVPKPVVNRRVATLLTSSPTAWYILHCGIHRIAGIYSAAPSTAGVSADEVLRQIQEDLLRNPEKGDVAQGLGGIRKARTSNPTRGKGKRGGYRYMHLYLKHRDHVHLLFLLDKDEQEDLTTEQRRNLRLIVAELKRL